MSKSIVDVSCNRDAAHRPRKAAAAIADPDLLAVGEFAVTIGVMVIGLATFLLLAEKVAILSVHIG